MQTQQSSSPTTNSVHAPPIHAPKEQPKAAWHRPTIIFVPLQTTANFTGSGLDGGSTSEVG